MRKLNLKLIYAAMQSCCTGYDNVNVKCTQENGILLQWEYSNNGKPIMHTMQYVSKPMLSRVDDVVLNKGLLHLIGHVKQRIRGGSI